MNTIMQRGTLALAVAGLLAVGAAAQATDSTMQSAPTKSGSQLSGSDRKFIEKAAAGGMAEVELGKLATEKASSDDVKQFGQRMVDDHGKANDQLKQLAASKGVQVPQELSSKDKATKDRLSKLSGADFDRAYMMDMVEDHNKDVAEFRHESTAAKDPDVKSFAAQTLPTLEDHLKQAHSVAPSQKSQSKQGGGMQMNSPQQ